MEGNNVDEEVDVHEYAQEHSVNVPENVELPGVTELLCESIPNEETLGSPRGRSGLRNIDVLQEEINCTITRDSIVLKSTANRSLRFQGRYRFSSQSEHEALRWSICKKRDLVIVSYDEKNGAVPMYITWDEKTGQSFEHVTSFIKYMLAVSKTSLQAAGLDEAKGQSGVALLYLWIQSVIKTESTASRRK